MAITTLKVEKTKSLDEKIPPLESGDRLTRSEFERRYEAMPHIKKAELIEGVVYMGSPVRHVEHGQPHAHIIIWLGPYVAMTPGIEISDNATVRLDQDNEAQPDALLRLQSNYGGRSTVNPKGYLEGAPEFVVEIAASSASYDLHDKKEVYRRAGVPEYVVWRIYDVAIDWFQLVGEEYVHLKPDENGVIHSRIFPGLRLAVEAMLRGELAAVLAELQRGLASPEHAAFVAKLTGETGAVPGTLSG